MLSVDVPASTLVATDAYDAAVIDALVSVLDHEPALAEAVADLVRAAQEMARARLFGLAQDTEVAYYPAAIQQIRGG